MAAISYERKTVNGGVEIRRIETEADMASIAIVAECRSPEEARTVARELIREAGFPDSEKIDPFELELRNTFDDLIDLLMRKRRAYGPGNLVRFGGIGIVIRASDKIDRLANLLKAGETVSADGDSIEEAFMDLCGYGVLGLLHQRGKLVP